MEFGPGSQFSSVLTPTDGKFGERGRSRRLPEQRNFLPEGKLC
jgi:hypothetical protein